MRQATVELSPNEKYYWFANRYGAVVFTRGTDNYTIKTLHRDCPFYFNQRIFSHGIYDRYTNLTATAVDELLSRIEALPMEEAIKE